jgi:protease I
LVKVLIVTGDGGEALEVLYPYFRLKEEGFEVYLAAPKKSVQTVVHDFEPWFDTYTEKLAYKVKADLTLAEVKPEEYAGLVLPGGRAPEYLRYNPEVSRIVKYFFEAGKPVAAICHAPSQILSALGLLHGRRAAAFQGVKWEVEAGGGTYVDAEVVVDGNLVTSRAWPDNPAWMREFIRLLKTG